MILDPDVCIRSDESLSEYSGRMAGMITVLRRKVRDYGIGKITLEELLEAAMIFEEEEQEMKEESPVTELLLDQLDELRHAISEHRRTVMAAGAYDLENVNKANTKLWEVLKS
jgi:hypothetical protein